MERTTRAHLESAFKYFLSVMREHGTDTTNWRLGKEYSGWTVYTVAENGGGEHQFVQGHIWKATELWNALRFATDILREVPRKDA
jgi:hypothetical protein